MLAAGRRGAAPSRGLRVSPYGYRYPDTRSHSGTHRRADAVEAGPPPRPEPPPTPPRLAVTRGAGGGFHLAGARCVCFAVSFAACFLLWTPSFRAEPGLRRRGGRLGISNKSSFCSPSPLPRQRERNLVVALACHQPQVKECFAEGLRPSPPLWTGGSAGNAGYGVRHPRPEWARLGR